MFAEYNTFYIKKRLQIKFEQSLYFADCMNADLLKRDSVQSHRYGCNFCSCLMIIAGLDLQDAPVAHPTHTDPVLLGKNNHRASVTFDPVFFYQPLILHANNCKAVLQLRLKLVTNDESS